MRILILESDSLLRDSVRILLEENQFKVMGVDTAEQAIRAVELFVPRLLILSRQCPDPALPSLLGLLGTNAPPTPVLALDHGKDAPVANALRDFTVAACLRIPFEEGELIRLAREAIEQAASVPFGGDSETNRFFKVAIEDFVFDPKISHPVFLGIGPESRRRYLKIAHTGEDLTPERLTSYREKGVQHLYISRADYLEYLGFTVSLTSAAAKSRIPPEKKARLVRHTMELVQQELNLGDLNPAAYDQARNVVESSLEVLSGTDQGYLLLESIRTISDPFYAHCTAVSLMSSLLAREMGWNSPATLTKVAMAGMFHDVGARQISREIMLKRRSERTADEARIYETHPQRGMEILSAENFIPSDLVQAVHQHHERGNGTGYPAHLIEGRIYPIAKVLAVADEFCQLYFESEDRARGDAKRTILRLGDVHSEGLSAEPLSALYRLYKMSVPERLLAKRP